MENNDFLNDTFLRDLIGKSSLESPSGGFVENLMNRIQPQPDVVHVKSSVFGFLKSSFGYFILAAIVVGFFLTSDISFMNWLPGRQYFLNTFLPYFNSIFSGIKSLSGGGKSISLPLMIVVASGLFFVIDRLLTHHGSARNYPSA